MSNDIFQERIDWTQVIPEIERHILKSDTEFEQEWEARVGAETTGRISRKWANAAKETSTAQAALDKILGDKLVGQECKRERILVLLYQYVGGDPEKVDAVKRGFQRQRDHMLNTADTLIKAANDVEQDFANLAFMGIQEYNTPEEDMRRCSKTLRDWANSVFKDLASERVSGRDHHLDALVKMVEEVTGTPHYAEIATLVDRVGLAYDPEFTKVIRDGESIYEAITPDAIRARIRRIRESGQPLFG